MFVGVIGIWPKININLKLSHPALTLRMCTYCILAFWSKIGQNVHIAQIRQNGANMNKLLHT